MPLMMYLHTYYKKDDDTSKEIQEDACNPGEFSLPTSVDLKKVDDLAKRTKSTIDIFDMLYKVAK